MATEEGLFHMEGSVFGGYYTVVNHLNTGTFGDIYEGVDKRNQTKVAIKFESIASKTNQLLNEYNIYKALDKTPAIPRMFAHGTQNGFNYLVTELIDMNLEELRILYGDKLPIKLALSIGDQMFGVIQSLHQKGFIHRDLKPENFLIDSITNNVYLIDFGLSISYINKTTHQHIPQSTNAPVVGTMRYASVNALSGYTQSRRDDLMSVFYIILYLINGRLPWQGLTASNKRDQCSKTKELKVYFHTTSDYTNLGIEMRRLYDTIKNLGFYETPDYNKIRTLLRNASIKRGFSKYTDWDPLPVRQPPTIIIPGKSKKLMYKFVTRKSLSNQCSYANISSHTKLLSI